jgi:4-hydroxy-4-methyl-2-oxoglutarate aldolase
MALRIAAVPVSLCVPEERAEAVIGEAEKAMNTENLVRKAILSGVSPKEAYLKYGKF